MAFASTLAVFALLITAHLAPSESHPPASGARAAVSAPRFEAHDLAGRRWTLADVRGRVVLIDFWATWCAPCLAELPRLKALHAKHSREHFEILGVSLDVTSRQSFVSWLNRNRIDWPQVHAKAGYAAELPRLFEVDRLPRTIVLDRDGTIAAMDVRGERLTAVIDRLLSRAQEPRR
jgi:thiol-disulfide isomerase/thioredoxin